MTTLVTVVFAICCAIVVVDLVLRERKERIAEHKAVKMVDTEVVRTAFSADPPGTIYNIDKLLKDPRYIQMMANSRESREGHAVRIFNEAFKK